MYRSILVPLDGSSLSEYALPMACDAASYDDQGLERLDLSEQPGITVR